MNRRTVLLAIAHAGLLALAGPVAAQRPPHIAHAGRGRIQQLAFGDWSYADGEHKAAVLLARYPDTNIIWGSNDSMALGVLRAVRARGAPVLVGGIGGFWDAIFTAFYTTKAQGLGMGLAISRSIVEQHGGRLWAVPHDGPGATVQFTLLTDHEEMTRACHERSRRHDIRC
jgi:hypothetical protein